MGKNLNSEEKIYQRIGELAVSFQWLENKLREIGWFILDPERSEWPPKSLRNLTNEKLINRIHELFIEALPKCKLPAELENEFKESMDSCAEILHQLRRDRNRILHSAFIELKAGGEVQGLVRSNPRLGVDEETGETLFDQEYLTPDSFDKEMKKMAEAALFLNRVYTQLIHRYPNGGAQQGARSDANYAALRLRRTALSFSPTLARRGNAAVTCGSTVLPSPRAARR